MVKTPTMAHPHVIFQPRLNPHLNHVCQSTYDQPRLNPHQLMVNSHLKGLNELVLPQEIPFNPTISD